MSFITLISIYYINDWDDEHYEDKYLNRSESKTTAASKNKN